MDPDGLKGFGKTLSWLLGAKKREGDLSPEELLDLVEEVADPGSLDSDQKKMISNISSWMR